ncbi:MAG TPA: RNA 2',3'-cyclic phosphodiesterase [Candidatus Acidoferrum sp.]|nr:RNA 2',3'-cyclic phosphodiesterase [Candidatus Acidoferrum sp.]
MYRLFVAIDPPPDIKTQLAAISIGVPGARWLTAEQQHLTLRFIGEVDGGVFRDVAEVLREVHNPPFDLTLCGVGHFPPRKDPEQLWVGVEKCEALAQLHNKIEAALSRIGVRRDGRKFAPHVTLAHLKNANINRVGGYLAGNNLLKLPPFPVTEFLLYSSALSSQGAIHQIEATYQLNGKENHLQ